MAGKPLTEAEKIKRDIMGLEESISLAGPEFMRALNAKERKAILDHLGWCQKEIAKLKARLKKSN